MTDERSPWARPDTEVVLAGGAAVHAPPTSPGGYTSSAPASSAIAARPASPVIPRPLGGPASPGSSPGRPAPGESPRTARYRSGNVTRLGLPSLATGKAEAGDGAPAGMAEAVARNRKTMRLFVIGAAAVLVIGLVAVVGLAMTGHTSSGGLFGRALSGPADTRPELAKRCPPPSDGGSVAPQNVPPPPPGPRTVDGDAGISYAAYGSPWVPWDQAWSGGTLHVTYRVGQHFITEPGPGGSGYHASILSGSVPATVNDAMVLDLECTGRQVAADVRAEYYVQPTTMDLMRDERTTLGGRPAWVTKFRLHFSHSGLLAKDELVAVVLINVGRPEAAILYVSIPGTNREWDHVVDEVIDSVRPT